MSKCLLKRPMGPALEQRSVAWCIYETHLLCFSHVTVARCQRGRPLGGTSGSNSFDPGAECILHGAHALNRTRGPLHLISFRMRDVIDSVCQTPWRAAKMKRAPMLYLLDRVSIESTLTLEQAPVLWPRYMHDKFRIL